MNPYRSAERDIIPAITKQEALADKTEKRSDSRMSELVSKWVAIRGGEWIWLLDSCYPFEAVYHPSHSFQFG